MKSDEHFVELKKVGAIKNGIFKCPECSHLRKKKNIKCLSVKETTDGEGLVFKCHHCGFSGYAAQDFRTRSAMDKKRTWHKPRDFAKMPVGSGTLKQKPAICFRYEDGWKGRSISEKYFTQKPGTKAQFWNLEAVFAGEKKEVFITEGEMDALALVECGIPADCVLAAPSATVGEMEYVKDALEAGLKSTKRFIWCGDLDGPGIELRAMMVQILGSARMNHVEWKEGIKDANEMLLTDGASDLFDLLKNGAVAWPIDGLYRMRDIPDTPPLTCWKTGFEGWQDRIALAPGTLSVATGHPGMGKTILWAQIWFQVVSNYELVAAVASFETRAKPHMQKIIRQLHGKKPQWTMTETELANADDWINQHYLFAVHPQRRPNLSWLLDMAEGAVVRYGARIIQIDPWNRLEAAREGRENETDYIARCLREIYNFAVDFNCHVQIIAHPSKMENMRRGSPPELEDIAGSKHWENMVDQGFVIHRPKLFDDAGQRQTYAELHHKKARFDELGYPTKFGLDFDPDQGRFGVCNLRKKSKKVEPVEDDT